MSLDRAKMEQFWDYWIQINKDAERTNDWSLLAACYAEDATYGWMYTPKEQFMAVGRKEIYDWALVNEMKGLDGWHYDYVGKVMDDHNGQFIGFWKQRAGIINDETGKEYEIAGIGGSWFGLQEGGSEQAGGLEIAWQRDWFDLGSTAHTFLEIIASGKAPQGLQDRMKVDGRKEPGHYTPDTMPSTIWPPVIGDD